jgi:predicted dehydrogenase
LLALQSLEASRAIRVCALVDGHDLPGQVFRHAFPRATLAASLESVVAPPGALVLLTTPPHLHVTQAAAALKRGWHVLSMSPLARSVREATAMLGSAQRHERLLSMALPWRFLPSTRYLRTLCRDHLLGPLFSFEIHDGVPPTAAPMAEISEGVLAETGTYAIDLLTWCLGSPTVVSYADDAMGGVEANAVAELSFPESVRGSLHLSRDWPTSRRYEFLFERGIVRWSPDQPNRLTVQLASAPGALDATVTPSIAPGAPTPIGDAISSAADNLGAQLKNVLAAILGREPLQVPASEALGVLTIVDHCYTARSLLEQPWFSRNENARARTLLTPSAAHRS